MACAGKPHAQADPLQSITLYTEQAMYVQNAISLLPLPPPKPKPEMEREAVTDWEVQIKYSEI